ncbi:hypothetical protein FQN57_003363 [Myotisia sp. PD_48]|nr:hypothetical protein FQN57_003363 [Myotisia sp. PD_48]
MAQDPVRTPFRQKQLSDDRFRFTPTGLGKYTRSWDRKLTTPNFHLSKVKSQKLWKRFPTGYDTTVTFSQEINVTFWFATRRGVKRLRIAKLSDIESRRSFLETKWETETEERKRKQALPVTDEKDHFQAELQIPTTLNDGSSKINNPLHFETTDDFEEKIIPVPDDGHQPICNEDEAHPIELIQTDLVHRQLPMSLAGDASEPGGENPQPKNLHLKYPPLDCDNAELLSDFISQAKAKRAAKSTVPHLNDPGDNVVELVPDTPTLKRRHALENMDVNSPCSARRQGSPTLSAPLPCRRSARLPLIKPFRDTRDQGIGQQEENTQTYGLSSNETQGETEVPPDKQQAPRIPKEIPLKRRNGTEFVFTQRSDEQRTSLLTKSNTKWNKGSSKSRSKLLQVINDATWLEAQLESSPRPARESACQKQVKWNDENLVEFFGDKKVPEFDANDYQYLSCPERVLRSAVIKELKLGHVPATPNGPREENESRGEPALARRAPAPRKMRKLMGYRHVDVHPNTGDSPPISRIKASNTRSAAAFPATAIRPKRLAAARSLKGFNAGDVRVEHGP